MENFTGWILGFVLSYLIGWLFPTVYLVAQECDYDYENNPENRWIVNLRWIPIVNLVFVVIAVMLGIAIVYMEVYLSIRNLVNRKRNGRRK